MAPDGLRPKLAPAYDLVCTPLDADHPDPEMRLDTTLALSLSRTKDPYAVTVEHLVRIAEKTGQDRDRAERLVRETATRAREVWAARRSELQNS